MAKVVGYEIDKLPAPVTTPSKYDTEYLAQFVKLVSTGKAAGDGETYADKKAATAAANSIKRAIRKHVNGELSLEMRVWQSGDAAFHFALSTNTRALTGAAAKAAAAKSTK